MTEISVLRPGSTVRLINDGPRAYVMSAILEWDHVLYRVVWWDGNSRQEDTVSPQEIVPDVGAKRDRIGFQ